jgi:hypothetical protein
MRNPMIVLCVLCALLAVPATASAQGNAAQDEYTENVPGAGGDRPSNEPGSGSPGGGSLPPGTTEQLQALGADGAAAAALAESTGSDRRGDGRDGPGSGPGSGAAAAADGSSGGGGVGEVVEDFVTGSEDDDGIGITLPLILGASLLAAIGFLLARRRGGTTAGPA